MILYKSISLNIGEKMSFENRFKIFVYSISTVIVIGILIPIIILLFSAFNTTLENTAYVVDGLVNLSNRDLSNGSPITLEGSFIAYEGVYLQEEQVDSSELSGSSIEELPTADLTVASTTYTYQFYAQIQQDPTRLVLCIPLIDNSVNVYINGSKVEKLVSDISWGGSTQISYFPLVDTYDETLVYQEILISINDEVGDSDLFKREIAISTEKNYLDYYKTNVILQVFLLGMMFLSTIIGIIYLIAEPKKSSLTYINLFDCILMNHILFNMTFIPNIFVTMFGVQTHGDMLFRRFDLFFLFFAGYLGNGLAKKIFDPNDTFNKIIDKAIDYAYILIAIILFVVPNLISTVFIWIILLLLCITFMMVVYKFMLLKKTKGVNTFTTFHFILTLFVGIVIAVDVYSINSSSFIRELILGGYFTFFFAHIIIRGIEYRRPFLEIQKMNEQLEIAVVRRTHELVKANAELKNISEIDALTKISNRMIFEQTLSMYVQELNTENRNTTCLHLCIFDIDNFKKINDTYGHQAGDTQLVELAILTQSLLASDILFARIGGEEFILLCKNYKDEEILSICENIRLNIEVLAKQEAHSTASFGISKAVSQCDKKDFFNRADKCLYKSKTSGKNKITYDFE